MQKSPATASYENDESDYPIHVSSMGNHYDRMNIQEDTDIETPLKAYITDNYSKSEAEEVQHELHEFAIKRKGILNCIGMEPKRAIANLMQWYQSLGILQRHFPFGKPSKVGGFLGFGGTNETVPAVWVWSHSYANPKEVPTCNFPFSICIDDVHHERSAVLFNVAAMHSLLGTKRENTLEGLTSQMKDFQASAGIFIHLNEHIHLKDATDQEDLGKSSLGFLADLMLAQASAAFFKKAIASKKINSTLLAKLAMGVSEAFEDCRKHIENSPDFDKYLKAAEYPFEEHLEIQSMCYEATACFHYGMKFFEADEYGIQLGYYEKALRLIRTAIQKISKTEGIIFKIKTAAKSLEEVLIAKHKEAHEDNEEIFHYSVPSEKELEAIPSKNVIKPLEFKSDSSDIADPFKQLVPKHIVQMVEKYEQNRQNLLHQRKNEALAAQSTVSNFLNSKNLPAAVDSVGSDKGLPEALWKRIEAVQRKGGFDSMNSIFDTLDSQNKKAWGLLEEAHKLLMQEADMNRSGALEYGESWHITPSSQLNSGYLEEHERIKGYLMTAASSNTKAYNEWKSVNEIVLTKFALSKKEMDQLVPKISDGAFDKKSVENLKQALDALEINQQKQIRCIDRLNERKVDKEQFVNIVMTERNKGNNKSVSDILIAVTGHDIELVLEALTKHIADQEELMKKVKTFHEAFVDGRKETPESKKREEFFHSLHKACETCDLLWIKTDEGLLFYTNLFETVLKPFVSKVTDYQFSRKIQMEELSEMLGKQKKNQNWQVKYPDPKEKQQVRPHWNQPGGHDPVAPNVLYQYQAGQNVQWNHNPQPKPQGQQPGLNPWNQPNNNNPNWPNNNNHDHDGFQRY